MASAFNLTAEINLRGPSNLNKVVSNIRKQLSGVNLNLNVNARSLKNIKSATIEVRNLSKALKIATTNANNLNAALQTLGASISSASSGMNTLGSGLNNVNKQMNSTRKAANDAGVGMEYFGKQSALAVRRFAAFSVATGGIYALTRAITSAYSEFITFNKEMVRLQQVTGSTAQSLKGISNEITKLSTTFGVASSELLTVSTTLAQAGLSATETKSALEALAKSALAPSFDNLNDTVEGSIALMKQFSLSSNELEASLGSINAVAAAFAVESGDIIKAIQRTGGVFAAASKGVSEGSAALQEFIALFTSVRSTTRESAETIATGLRTIFTRIQRGSTINALKEYGVVLTDLEDKFVGPYEAIKRLSEGLKNLDPRDVRFSQIVEELGGFRQIGKVIPLIQQFTTAQQALGVAQRGAGSLAEAAATAQESLAIKIMKVKQEFTALIRDIGQSDSFQKFADISLRLASALISVASAAKDVLPALAALAAIKTIPAIGQFVRGFGSGFARKNQGGYIQKFAAGGLVPGSGNRDTVPAMLTPGEFVIRKKAVETIGRGSLQKMNKYGIGGFAKGRSTAGIRRGARSKFKELTEEEIAKLSTADLIKYAKAQARDIFSTGGAGMVTKMKFTPVAKEKITPELEPSLTTYLGKKGFWREVVSPFGQPAKDIVSRQRKASRSEALSKQESRIADEVAARNQEWTKIRSGSGIDNYLLSSLKDPILSDYMKVRSGQTLTKQYHNTRLRQAVNKSLEFYDDFDYSSGNIDKLISAFASKQFFDGGPVQKFMAGKYVKKQSFEEKINQNMRKGKKYNFGLVGLRSGTKSGVKKVDNFNITRGKKDNQKTYPVTLHQATFSELAENQEEKKIEKNISEHFSNMVKSTSSILASRIGGKSASTNKMQRILKGSPLTSVVGSVFEAALASLGAPYIDKAEKTKSMDFPLGLGGMASSFGIPGNIPTDATRTIGGVGKGLGQMKGQIGRFIAATESGEFTKSFADMRKQRLVSLGQKTAQPSRNILSSIFNRLPKGTSIAQALGPKAGSFASKYGLSKSQLGKQALMGTGKKGAESIILGKGGSFSDFVKELDDMIPILRAAGGSISGEDRVPALLTPGEFVINKKAAKKIGSSKLHKLNKADKLQGFNKGGSVGGVQSFAGGGGVQNFFLGGVVKPFAALAKIVTNLSRKMALLGKNVPQGGGWTGKNVVPLSQLTNPNNQKGGMGSGSRRDSSGMGMALMFIGPMIAESINSAMTKNMGQGGAVAGSVITSAISGATIGSVAGPWGALAGVAVGLTSGLLNMQTAAENYTKAQNELIIDSKAQGLDKALKDLSQKIGDTASNIASANSALISIINTTTSNKDIEIRQAQGMVGMEEGTWGRWVGETVRDTYLGDLTDYWLKELTGEVPKAVDTNALNKQLLSSSMPAVDSLQKSIATQLSSGISFEDVMKGVEADTAGVRRTLAIARGGDKLTKLEAERADIEARRYKDRESFNPDTGKFEVQKGTAEEVRQKDLEIINEKIATATKDLSDEQLELMRVENEGATAVKALSIELDFFNENIKNVKASLSRATSDFNEAFRQIDITTGPNLGNTNIANVSRVNENIFENLRAYSPEETIQAIDSLSRTLGFSEEFTKRNRTNIIAEQRLQTELPKILLTAAAKQSEAGQIDETVKDDLDALFKDLEEAFAGEVDPEIFTKAFDKIIKDLGKGTMSLQGKSLEEIAQSSPELQKLLKAVSVSSGIYGESSKSFNDMMDKVIGKLNEYSNHLNKIMELEIRASTMQVEAANNLDEALGKPVSLDRQNRPFEMMLEQMTSVNGPNGLMAGTTDPTEIERRLANARKRYEQAQQSKPGAQAGQEAIDAWSERVAKAKTTVDRLANAQQKLAEDTTRASNALNRIRGLRQATEARRGSFNDVLRNINNPEWMSDFINQVNSLERVSSGVGTLRDIPRAVDAFEKRLAGMDPEKREAATEKFYNDIFKILERAGVDVNDIDKIKELIGQGAFDNETEKAIRLYNKAIEDSRQSTLFMAENMKDSAQQFFEKIVEAANEFVRKVGGAGVPPEKVKLDVQQAANNSNGGLIYASKGKLINYQPRGTDTVPAMLTPGEFVVNAKATKQNLSLLKSINSGKALSKGGVVYANQGGLIGPDLKAVLDELYEAPVDFRSSADFGRKLSELTEDELYAEVRKHATRPPGATSAQSDMLYEFVKSYEKRQRDQEQKTFEAERQKVDEARAAKREEYAKSVGYDSSSHMAAEVEAHKLKEVADYNARFKTNKKSLSITERAELNYAKRKERYDAEREEAKTLLAESNALLEQHRQNQLAREQEEKDKAQRKVDAEITKARLDEEMRRVNAQRAENLAMESLSYISPSAFNPADIPEGMSLEEFAFNQNKEKYFNMLSHSPAMNKEYTRVKERLRDFIAGNDANIKKLEGEQYNRGIFQRFYQGAYLGGQDQNSLMIKQYKSSSNAAKKVLEDLIDDYRKSPIGSDRRVKLVQNAENAMFALIRQQPGTRKLNEQMLDNELDSINKARDAVIDVATSVIPGGAAVKGAKLGTKGVVVAGAKAGALLGGITSGIKSTDANYDVTNREWRRDPSAVTGKQDQARPITDAEGIGNMLFDIGSGAVGGGIAGGIFGGLLAGGGSMLGKFAGTSFGKKTVSGINKAKDFMGGIYKKGKEALDYYGDPEVFEEFLGRSRVFKPFRVVGEEVGGYFEGKGGRAGEAWAKISDSLGPRSSRRPTPRPNRPPMGTPKKNQAAIDAVEAVENAKRKAAQERDAMKKPTGTPEKNKKVVEDLERAEEAKRAAQNAKEAADQMQKDKMKAAQKAKESADAKAAQDKAKEAMQKAAQKAKEAADAKVSQQAAKKSATESVRETDFYKTFGTKPGEAITPDMIKAARRRYSKFLHPDLNPGIDPSLQSRFNNMAQLAEDPQAMKMAEAIIANGFKDPKTGKTFNLKMSDILDSYTGNGKFSRSSLRAAGEARAKMQAAKQAAKDAASNVRASQKTAGSTIPRNKFEDMSKSDFAKTVAGQGEIVGSSKELRQMQMSLGSKVSSEQKAMMEGFYRQLFKYRSTADSNTKKLIFGNLYDSAFALKSSGVSDKGFSATRKMLEQEAKKLGLVIDRGTKPEDIRKVFGSGGVGLESGKSYSSLSSDEIRKLQLSRPLLRDMENNILRSALFRQNGGPIYASSGTLVPYQPRGTDTVPAMLTPGEFVVNAKSAKKNMGLLRAINGGAKGYSKGGVVYLQDGGAVGDLEYKIQAAKKEKEQIRKALMQDKDTFFYWALSSKGGDIFANYGYSGLTPVDADGNEKNPRGPSSWTESDRQGRGTSGKIESAPITYTIASEYLANLMGREAFNKLSANEQDAQTLDAQDYFDTLWQNIHKQSREMAEPGYSYIEWWRTPLYQDGEKAALQKMNDAQARTDALARQIQRDEQELRRLKDIPNENERRNVPQSGSGKYPKVGGGRTDDIAEADQSNMTIPELIAVANETSNTSGVARQIAQMRLQNMGIDWQSKPQAEVVPAQKTLSEAAKTAAEQISFGITSLIDSDLPEMAVSSLSDINRGLDILRGEGFNVNTGPVSDVLTATRDRIIAAKTEKAMELSNFYRENVLPALGDLASQVNVPEIKPKSPPQKQESGNWWENLGLTPYQIEMKRRREGYQKEMERRRGLRRPNNKDSWEPSFLSGSSTDFKTMNKERAERLALGGIHPRSPEQQERYEILKILPEDRSEEQKNRLAELRKQWAESKGIVYASKGQFINFAPKGTDTIPAMLTPGEFVVNRKATKQNLGLLKAINNNQFLSNGGLIKPKYFQNGGLNTSSVGSGMGNGVSLSIDSSNLDSAFQTFGGHVQSLQSIFGQFNTASETIARSINSLDLTSGFTALAGAINVFNGSSGAFNSAITLFNNSVGRLETAFSEIPDSISLNVNGSIPVDVTVTVNGGEGLSESLNDFKNQIYNDISSSISAATGGKLKINLTTTQR